MKIISPILFIVVVINCQIKSQEKISSNAEKVFEESISTRIDKLQHMEQNRRNIGTWSIFHVLSKVYVPNISQDKNVTIKAKVAQHQCS